MAKFGPLENLTHWDSYDWIPKSKCEFDNRWSEETFCRLVQNKNILFLGDSIMREQFMSLISYFGWRKRKEDVFRDGRVSICNATRNNVFFRYDPRLNTRNVPSYLKAHKPQIILANRGVWFQNNTDALVGVINSDLGHFKKWQDRKECRKSNGGGCLLIWKTAVPGHPNCADFDGPVNDLEIMEHHVGNQALYDKGNYVKWGWWKQKQQNERVLELFASNRTDDIDYAIMDAYHVNILRPDLHRWNQGDCLHNCSPGKTEILNQILLHILKMKALGQIYDPTIS